MGQPIMDKRESQSKPIDRSRTNAVSDDVADQFDGLAEEYACRLRSGENPSIEEFVARCPACATEIRELFPALAAMEQAIPTSPAPSDGDFDTATRTFANFPRRLKGFQIVREIGRGGMGIVYEAIEESLGRHVAVKVLPTHSMADARQIMRFEREARAAARLHHTNIVPVFGVGQSDGLHYYVMQFIQGLSLDAVIDELRVIRQKEPSRLHHSAHTGVEGKQPQSSAARIARTLIGDAGEFQPVSSDKTACLRREDAATRVPIHSAVDEKHVAKQSEESKCLPDGLLSSVAASAFKTSSPYDRSTSKAGEILSQSGSHSGERHRKYFQSVARMGLQVSEALTYAHGQGILHRDIKPANLLLDTSGNIWVTDFGLAKAEEMDDLTRSGDVIGTLRYMAPEQLNGSADGRTDIYSLGVTLYELLTLRPPFEANHRGELARAIAERTPRRPRVCDSNIPRDLETIVLKALAKQPSDRYQQASAMSGDLRRFLEDIPIHARRIHSLERAWRWARRNPVVAGLAATVLLLAVSLTAALAISNAMGQQRDVAISDRKRAENAETDARRLRDRAIAAEREAQIHRHLSNSNLLRQSGKPGQRFDALDEIRKAAQLRPSDELAGRLRDAAIAAMRMTDIRILSQLDFGGETPIQFDSDLSLAATMRFGHSQPIAVWDVKKQRVLVELAGPSEPIWHATAAFSKDGRYVAVTYGLSGRDHEQLHVWDLSTTELLLDQAIRCLNVVASVCFHPDCQQLIFPNIDGELIVWDLIHRQPKRNIHFGFAPSMIRFDGSGTRLAVGAMMNPLVQVLDFNSGLPILTLAEKVGDVSVDLSDDGRLLACGNAMGASLWDVASGRRTFVLGDHASTVFDTQFIANSELLMTRSWDGTALISNCATGQPQLSIPVSIIGPSDNGQLLGDVDAIWSLTHSDVTRTLHAGFSANGGMNSRQITCLSPLSPDSGFESLIVLGCNDGIQFWDWRQNRKLGECDIGRCSTVAFHPQGKSLLTVSEAGVLIWPISRFALNDTGCRIGPPQLLCKAIASHHFHGCWLRGGEAVAISDQHTNQVWVTDADPKDGNEYATRRLRSAYGRFVNLAASADGIWLASGGHKEFAIQVWNVNSGELVKLLPHSESQEDTIFYVSFTPDSKYLMALSSNKNSSGFYFFDVATWERVSCVPSSTIYGPSVFSADSRLVTFKTDRDQITLAQLPHGEPIAHLQTEKFANANGFTHDGRWLSLSRKSEIEFWDLSVIARELTEIGLASELAVPLDSTKAMPPAIELVVDTGVSEQFLLDGRRIWKSQESVNTAQILVTNGKYSEAIRDYENAIALCPQNELALNSLAWLLVTCPQEPLWDCKRALELAQRANQIRPSDSVYLNTLGVAQFRNGQYQEAIDSLLAAENYEPNSWFAHNFYFIAMARWHLGQFAQAVHDFTRAELWTQAHAPDDPELIRFRAEAIGIMFLWPGIAGTQ